MQEKLEECLAAIWKEWSSQAAELQVLRADVENWAKAGDNFYKMYEESIITIQEELAEDFQAMAQVQTAEIQRKQFWKRLKMTSCNSHWTWKITSEKEFNGSNNNLGTTRLVG